MKKLGMLFVSSALLLSANVAQARDSITEYSIKDLLDSAQAKQVLLDFPLFFADQKHGKVAKKYSEVITNKKTNAFNKSDSEACNWVMLSALKALQERAQREGMNAVINIESYYKKRKFVSATHFECGAGTFMAGVALKGTPATLKK